MKFKNEELKVAADAIRVLVADMVEQANSGHPGGAMGQADVAATLWLEYLKVNPKGRVPVLETPDGILTETGAILEYIAPDLVPTDPFAAARMREIMYYVCGTMHVNHAHNRRGARWADDAASHADMKRKVPETMAASCVHLEQLWHLRPDGLTIADFYLYVVLCWLEGDGVDIKTYPQFADFAQNMRARPSVQAVYDKGVL